MTGDTAAALDRLNLPILYFSPSLAAHPDADQLSGVIDATNAGLLWHARDGVLAVLPELPADAVQLVLDFRRTQESCAVCHRPIRRSPVTAGHWWHELAPPPGGEDWDHDAVPAAAVPVPPPVEVPGMVNVVVAGERL